MKKRARREEQRQEKEKGEEMPLLFPKRPKAPPWVRIAAALALMLLLWAMYHYAARSAAAADAGATSRAAPSGVASFGEAITPAPKIL